MASTLRYAGGAVGFGFGAMWMTTGIGSAIACLLLAALGCGVVLTAERAQANGIGHRPANETPEPENYLVLEADELDLDDASYHEPSYDEPLEEAPTPLAAEVEYGWPSR